MEAIELADAYLICDGNPLAESQKITLRGALGERADGSWAATRVGDFGPRQGTGKNDKIAARELAGLIVFGEKLQIHTAHEFPTANEAFLRMVGIFENWDDLRRRVSRIRYANGEQGIEFLSGQRLKYRARTGGSGRGFAKADLLVYDEAQHLAREHVAASGPAKLANPNSQTWYAGSGGLATSAMAWAMRRAALLGTGGRLAYTEMTGEQVSVVGGRVVQVRPDPADRDVWYAAMPGLGRWVTEEGMQALYEELGEELFLRECLCVWDPELGTDDRWTVIPKATWEAHITPSSRIEGARSFAFDVTPDRAWSSIAVAGVNSRGVPHRELVDHRPGTAWLHDRLVELNAKWEPLTVVADGAAAAGSFIDDLEQARVPVTRANIQDVKAACGRFYDDITEGDVAVLPHPALDAAVAGADQRTVGDAWAWDRRGGTVISPLVAVTLAAWAHTQGDGPSAYETRGMATL